MGVLQGRPRRVPSLLSASAQEGSKRQKTKLRRVTPSLPNTEVGIEVKRWTLGGIVCFSHLSLPVSKQTHPQKTTTYCCFLFELLVSFSEQTTVMLMYKRRVYLPAASAHSLLGQQISSPGEAGGECPCCSPGTMTSHSFWRLALQFFTILKMRARETEPT